MPVRYRGRLVGFDTPAPASTRRRHETPTRGDSQSAIIRASGGCLDFNMTALTFNTHTGRHYLPVAGHWPNVGQNGWTHTNIGGGIRPLTKAEKHMSLQSWVNSHGGNIHALNSLLKHAGRHEWDYAMTWGQAVPFAADHNTILTPELKSQAFRFFTLAKHMASVCREHDYPFWAMALVNMKYAREKCAAVVAAGGSFALIYGHNRRLALKPPAGWPWTPKPTRNWGPVWARRWWNK